MANIDDILNSIDKKAYLFGAVFCMANKMQQLGDNFDKRITLKQWRILSAVAAYDEKGATISMIAEFTSSSGQNIKKMAVILQNKGYLEINPDKKDARYVRMFVTEKALELFESRSQQEKEFIDELFKDMDEKMVDGFYVAMKKWYENIVLMEKKCGPKNKSVKEGKE